MLLNDSVLHLFKPERVCKVVFKDWLFAREGMLWAIALLPGV